ncbi:hypothetical protein F4677DRAFT_450756 [Hypoxylon crocopeplum]|nr:hypothetical protein F4677DRAFT_450756 [Hypoxylon crocopeplum]
MPPHIPYHVSAGSNPLSKFGGMLVTEFLEPPPGRSVCIRQRYRVKLPPELSDDPNATRQYEARNHPSGPPVHFHPFQNEWFRVEQGRMCVEIDGRLKTLTPEDGEVFGRAGCIHRFFIAPDSTEDMVAIISGSDPGRDYQLDRIFFENWYGLWHDYLVHEDGKMDMIQILCTYDAGDVYLLGPAFLPARIRRFIGYWAGVVIGRWIGGMLGYKPFFKEYTTDWDYAIAKMQSSFFTRRLVQTTWKKATPLVELNKRNSAWEHGGGTADMVRSKINGYTNGNANGVVNGV